MRRVAIAAALLFSLAAIAFVGLAGASWLFQDTETSRFTVEQPVAKVAVAGRGDVHVVATDGGPINVERTTHEFIDEPKTSWSVVDGVLRLESRCDDEWAIFTRCHVDYRVEVPAGTPIAIEAEHGDVRVEGATGALELVARHGDVAVQGARGDVRLRTEHGDVNATEIQGATVVVSSRHGDVDLALDRAPSSVEVATEHGDIDLSVPAGAYRVDESSDHGDSSVDGVERDDAASRSLVARTEHGDVSIRGR